MNYIPTRHLSLQPHPHHKPGPALQPILFPCVLSSTVVPAFSLLPKAECLSAQWLSVHPHAPLDQLGLTVPGTQTA